MYLVIDHKIELSYAMNKMLSWKFPRYATLTDKRLLRACVVGMKKPALWAGLVAYLLFLV